MLETIKQYLVSLGFSVDKSSYNEATKAMDKAGESVAKFAGKAMSQFGLAGAAVTTFAVTAVLGISKFISSLGESQIEIEKTARQMWISQDNAMAFNATLKALGANLQDLYLSPTLAEQFMELRKEAFTLAPPAEYKQQMQLIQSIAFEFKRMKLEATYALQWIGYYFIKYMQGPITNVKLTLSNINDIIIKTMPSWTKVVAEVMGLIAQFGITVVQTYRDVGKTFEGIAKSIPNNIKLIGAAIAALALVVETGPVGILIAAFTVLILLLNDFYTYLKGGQSEFGPFWKKLIDFYNQLNATGGVIDKLKTDFTEFFSKVGKSLEDHKQIWTNLKEIASDFGNGVKKVLNDLQGPLDWIGTTGLPAIVDAALSATEGITGFIHEMDQFGATGAIIAGVGAAWITYKGILIAIESWTKLVTAAQWAWNVAMDANPVGIIVTAVGLLVTGLVLLIENWGSVKKAAIDAIDWCISKINDLIKAIDLIPGIKIPLIPMVNDGSGNKHYGLPAPNYIYPNTNTQNNNNSKVTLNQTNNIYGSDPKATADQAHNNFEDMYLRNMRGVIQ